jgi:hypothetical protein
MESFTLGILAANRIGQLKVSQKQFGLTQSDWEAAEAN